MARAATASTPSWEVLASAAAHVLFFALVILARCGSEAAQPLFKADEVMVVEMAGPAENVTRMPQKAERTPDAVAGSQAADEPAPLRQSDMALQTPDAKTKGDAATNLERERLVAQMRRQALLDNLDAPIGTTDRAASSPDGAGTGGEASAGVRDPELAKWILASRQRVSAKWNPLLSICQQDPTLTVLVRVDVDANGKMTASPEVAQSSGNASFDEAARRAVEMTGALPPPPPRFTDGVIATLKFVAKEAL